MVEKKKSKKPLIGIVVSDKMDKTIVVATERLYKEPRFQKYVKKVKKYKVHDDASQAKVGDVVEFYEGRPVSKTKYMYLKRIVDSKV